MPIETNAHIRLADLLETTARHHPSRPAFADATRRVNHARLHEDVCRCAAALQAAGIVVGERVAVFAPKRYETVVFLLAANLAGAVVVPINPQLKEHQTRHILEDCKAALLATTRQRLRRLGSLGAGSPPLCWFLDELPASDRDVPAVRPAPVIDSDPAAILYTSGSTGGPKGVVLSQRNLVAGAQSVAAYQRLQADDVVLGVLPLSFDAGLSQLTTALAVGACYAPLEFLKAEEVPIHCDLVGATAITGVPALWMQLAAVRWPAATGARVRRIANTGGHMPTPLLQRLRGHFPNALPYLMYGLTEAFRSTYLAPEDADSRPTSIGQAVPNAEVLVLRPDGTECAADETGELVHRGAFVTLGYWNAPELTAHRFRPLPQRLGSIPRNDVAVWSGDLVRRDAEGYLYFVARADDMIKTSGYRVSPTEVEDIVFGCVQALEAAAFGVPHDALGQAIVVCARARGEPAACAEAIARRCRELLPSFMQPRHIDVGPEPLPRNANGKIDRQQLKTRFARLFDGATPAADLVA